MTLRSTDAANGSNVILKSTEVALKCALKNQKYYSVINIIQASNKIAKQRKLVILKTTEVLIVNTKLIMRSNDFASGCTRILIGTWVANKGSEVI